MIDKRLALTKKQKALFDKFKQSLDNLLASGVYLLPWDEAAYPVNMKHVEHICPDDFRKGDKSKYIEFSHIQLGINLRVEHESCYINTNVCIKFKEPTND